jgi:hypothetical protein
VVRLSPARCIDLTTDDEPRARARSSSENVRLWTFAMLGCALLLSGCAVQYYDPETGTTHVWGLGHMSMKISPPNEGVQAVVRATSILGLSLGRTTGDRTYFTLGYDSEQQTDIVAESTAVRLEWPAGDLFNLRAGSQWPTGMVHGSNSHRNQSNETPGTKQED